jgi:VanZ family protein
MSLAHLIALARRAAAILFWPALALVIWGELTSHAVPVETHIWDKLLHFTAYFGLALIAAFARRSNRALILTVLALVVLGGLLEIVQGMVGRDADIKDEIANTIGAVTGGALGWAFLRLRDRLVAPDSRD